jgi:HD-like signal output (HDOD) protein
MNTAMNTIRASDSGGAPTPGAVPDGPALQLVAVNEIPDVQLDEIIERAGELAALPQVIMRLIDLTSDPRASAGDVERVVQSDQAVAARVLTLANSSYYGLPRRVSSIREAVVFLGFKSVRNLAMTVTAFNMFLGKSDAVSMGRRDLWRHSLNTALCTRIVCGWMHSTDAASVSAEEAFTAGLLHDIGKMGLDIALPNEYGAAVQAAHQRNLRLHEVESEFLPWGHAAVGSALAMKWNLPALLCDALEHHHAPVDSQVNPQFVAAVSLADEIAETIYEQAQTQQESVIPDIENSGATILRFSPDALRGIFTACRLEMEKGLALKSFS